MFKTKRETGEKRGEERGGGKDGGKRLVRENTNGARWKIHSPRIHGHCQKLDYVAVISQRSRASFG